MKKSNFMKKDGFLSWLLIFVFSLCCDITAIEPLDTKFANLISKSPPKWMLEQVERDLCPYSQSGISIDSIDRLMAATLNQILARIRINNGEISFYSDVEHLIEHPAFQIRLKPILDSLAELSNHVRLPNIDFVISLDDSTTVPEHPNLAPLFVFSKNKYSKSMVLIPDLDALMGYGKLTRNILSQNKLTSWASKKNQAFWRGSTTNGIYTSNNWKSFPRAQLVLLSLKHPSLIDAKFVTFVQGAESCPEMLARPELVGHSITPQDSLIYKYLIDIDGNTCAWSRLYWTLLSNSVVFKQVTDNIEWYYCAIEPYKHFIPIKADLSDLPNQIIWAKKNDRKLKRIAKSSTKFVQKNLNQEMIYLYFYLVLKRYAELQTF